MMMLTWLWLIAIVVVAARLGFRHGRQSRGSVTKPQVAPYTGTGSAPPPRR